ncbi:MAG: hypothetical protein A2915_03350 [Candidatus Yanofskybacteria bacterium RIFCSPLOWO2_01_FULL_41_34]|uniref:Glycosyl transferase family 1 domain-containing protein n=1 Tax=Candidatus Yanofskybacteria bacterium RIFCSPHIGHO2_01_FULL_41_26 TaxID=1802661 RepID=A0A1F8EDS7_9BACT|nr:MAG: hypothetical protein A2649_01245 [Candidatus Yanofskybacteria bacterium RIFCSPHIGHO2_01_FULL_41_26]OGN21067.1 MAG: hypothetical protein A2915_03350 [Candidatus Yanofskybacteria bacterium RIFCSPLOWO2_01_FULL_41_34]
MAKLLMITGLGSAKDLASGKKGAFYNTLEEFHKYWDRIDIISPKTYIGSISNLPKAEPLFGNVYVHISPWPLILHPFWFLKKGMEIYKEQKFDLMIVHEFPPFYNGIGARLLWLKTKVPYVLEIHHISGYPKAANPKESVYRILMGWLIKFDASKATAVRVVNQKQTLEFLVKAGVPENKITYIPSIYIDLNMFKPMNLPKEYDLIFIGRLEPNKGIVLLIEAAKKLKVQGFKLRILIVGDGSLKNYCESKIENWKLQDNVLLYGWAKDSQEVAKLLNQSKILVMSSFNEGGPRVVVEAMACGVPVLATPVGIVPDLLKNGLEGEIVAWEANYIAHKAIELLNSPDLYQKYSQGGLEIVGQFEKKATIKDYAEKLQNLLK